MNGKAKTENVNQTQSSQQSNQNMKNNVKLLKKKKMESGIAMVKTKKELNVNFIAIKEWLFIT